MARGNWQAGGLQLRVWNPDGSAEQATTMTARLRDEYLILAYPGGEAGYARPGRPLVRSAEGSAEAETLARLIVGRIYSVTNQASGRGAFVGGRVKLALCADGSIAYDASNLVATPSPLGDAGVDGGESVSRRGQWSVVLLAGAPTVQARWQGTGSSYSLTRYFRIRPDASGQSAEVDGKLLPMTGRC